jgi:asparagine synthase (glutamine-hydrolysing)
LPPAHVLTRSPERGVQTRRYWTMPMPELIRYKNTDDYLDRFQELMAQAVGDRLRMDKVASSFSGGLDSTTIAATALAVAKARSQPLDLKAFTTVYDRLIPDRERYYAGVAAAELGISIEYQVADDYQPYQDWQNLERSMPQPCHNPLQIVVWESFEQISAHSRVVLSGDGGDEALASATVVEMLQTMPLWDVAGDVLRCFGLGTRPGWGSGVLSRLRRWRKPHPAEQIYPTWIESDFARSIDLEQRWAQINQDETRAVDSPRSQAYHRSTSALWTTLFEANDAGASGVPAEVRFPFFDLRLLGYLLALPPAPWCTNKMLLRMATKQSLPAEIRLRPKTPLARDPLSTIGLQNFDRSSLSTILPTIECYVSIDRLFELSPPLSMSACWEFSIPISLAYWIDRHLKLNRDRLLLRSISRHDTS